MGEQNIKEPNLTSFGKLTEDSVNKWQNPLIFKLLKKKIKKNNSDFHYFFINCMTIVYKCQFLNANYSIIYKSKFSKKVKRNMRLSLLLIY